MKSILLVCWSILSLSFNIYGQLTPHGPASTNPPIGNPLFVSTSFDGIDWSQITQLREASKFGPSLFSTGEALTIGFISNNLNNHMLLCSSKDRIGWTANQIVGGDYNEGVLAPALAVFNGRLFISWFNKEGSIHTSSSTDGNSWSTFNNIGQGSAARPSLTEFKGKLWMSFISKNSDRHVLVCSSSDGFGWSNNTSIGLQSQSWTPTITKFQNKLWIAALEKGSSLIRLSSSDDGTNWTIYPPFGESSKTAPSIAVFNNKLWLAFTANDPSNDILLSSSENGKDWVPHSSTNLKTDGSEPALTVFQNMLAIAFKGPGGNATTVPSVEVSTFPILSEINNGINNLPTIQNICMSDPKPSGWIGTDVSTAFSGPCAPSGNARGCNTLTIINYDRQPIGAMLHVLASEPTPNGWESTGYFYEVLNLCQGNGGGRNQMKQIRRVNK